MTRKDFLSKLPLLPAAAAAGAPPDAQVMENPAFTVAISAAESGVQARVVHRGSGMVLADAPYSYSLGVPLAMRLEISHGKFTLEGIALGHIKVNHQIRVPEGQPWIEEEFAITNTGSQPVNLDRLRCGFVLPVRLADREAAGTLKDFRFTAIPYRREPSGDRHQYTDYTVGQVLSEPRFYHLRAPGNEKRNGARVNSTVWGNGLLQTESWDYASEGWCLTDGRRGFVLSKYSQDGMEWAILDRVPLSAGQIGLRWGGIGIYFGDPEHGSRLGPGETHRFGVTRLTACDGGLTEGFYAFRSEMESRGQGCPKDYDPPSHWNELYDNQLWWLPDGGAYEPENKKKYYTLKDMREEAAKAKEIGCEALYLDPGWDTSFASKIWDESRLGKLTGFVAMLNRDFGLKLSLHTPLSGWCDSSSYPRTMDRMGRDGRRIEGFLCGASRQYVDETVWRLDVLARDGATFFMFDGTAWCGECWDPNHGHPVPAVRHEHVEATNRLARQVHEKHPNVLIEMHGQILGGTYLRYVPTYYGHGNGGFDDVWAFELMWDPMRDLISGHSIALYYFNLAYSLPLYIHIDLRRDNTQALMLWWNISTCRHLGLGGTHKDPVARKAHKDAMTAYRRLKPFFASGVFYGIDEQTHVHRHPTESRAVINCFNLEDRPVTRALAFDPARFGLDPARRYEVPREVTIPAYGHVLVESNPAV
jgi:hypothetical protein